MIIAISVLLQLALSKAPSVAPETLIAFARHESNSDPNTIHDNTTGLNFHLQTPEAATTFAAQLLAQGHSLDLGLMQINRANLAVTGLTIRSAFDPGESLRAGAQILSAAYQQCRHGGQVERQAALRCAASVYNTGTERAGILNGYQARVWRAATEIVPAIQVAGVLPQTPRSGSGDTLTAPVPPTAVMEDLLHGGPPVPLSSNGLEDALPHDGGNK